MATTATRSFRAAYSIAGGTDVADVQAMFGFTFMTKMTVRQLETAEAVAVKAM